MFSNVCILPGRPCLNTLKVLELSDEDYEENLPVHIEIGIDQSIEYCEDCEPDPECNIDNMLKGFRIILRVILNNQ